jgi:tetratricopeptide (TPR) repeat protein
MLLPQIGFPQSMLDRQISLLANAKKDSLMADLFGEVYEARGERIYLENQIRLLFGMKRFEEALSGIEEFRADTAFADDSLSVAFLVAAYVGLNQDTIAVDSLKAIYKRHPDNYHVLMNLALLETKLEKKSQALVHWNRLATTDKYAASAFGMLSVYVLEDGDSAKSLQYLEKAYDKEPLAYRSALLVRYAKMRAYQKAYKVLETATAPNPKLDSMRAKIQESGNLEELRKFETAETMDRANAHYSYGTFLQMNAEDLERAPTTPEKLDSAKALRKLADDHYMAASKMAGDTPNLLFAYASNLLMYDQVDSAIAVFKKIFVKYPQDATAKNHLGYYLVDMNRSPDEVKWGNSLIDEALKMEPSNVAYKDSKGWALYRLGKYKEALAMMEQVEAAEDSLKEMFYQDTSIYAHLAAICQALSLNARALDYYQKVLNIDPKNENAKKQIEILKQAIKEAENVQKEPAKAPAAEKDSGKAP